MSFVIKKIQEDQQNKTKKGNQLLIISENDEENKFNQSFEN